MAEGYPHPPQPTADFYATCDWWEPELLQPGHINTGSLLSDEQVNRWVEEGFLCLDNIWPVELISRAAEEAYRYFPEPDQREEGDTGSELSGSVARRCSRGKLWPSHVQTAPSSARQVAMPFFDLDDVEASPDLAINEISLHPRMLSIASQLLGTDEPDLRCDLNVLRCRYGVAAKPNETYQNTSGRSASLDGNQDMHVDYGNLNLLVPPRLPRPDAFILILYFTHVAATGGPTHAAASAPGELTTYGAEAPFNPPNLPNQAGRDRGILRRVYETERPVRYSPGTCLLYRLDSWHRGTPVALGKHRVAQHIMYRRASVEWASWQAYSASMSAMPGRFLAGLSPVQRGVLGFPLPGHSYWTQDTAAAVGRRYQEMDMSPYLEALLAQGGARL
jgi:hypothetical protein